MSSTRMTSPAPISLASPSLAVIFTPASRLMMYCRRGAGCERFAAGCRCRAGPPPSVVAGHSGRRIQTRQSQPGNTCLFRCSGFGDLRRVQSPGQRVEVRPNLIPPGPSCDFPPCPPPLARKPSVSPQPVPLPASVPSVASVTSVRCFPALRHFSHASRDVHQRIFNRGRELAEKRWI